MLDIIKVKRNEKKCYGDGGRKSNCFSSLFFLDPFQGHLQGKVFLTHFTLFLINHSSDSYVIWGGRKERNFWEAYEEVDHHLSRAIQRWPCGEKHTEKKRLKCPWYFICKKRVSLRVLMVVLHKSRWFSVYFFISMCKETVMLTDLFYFSRKTIRTFPLFFRFWKIFTSDFSSHSIVCCTILLSLADTTKRQMYEKMFRI